MRTQSTLITVMLLVLSVLPFASASNWFYGSNYQVGPNWTSAPSFSITITSAYGSPTSSGTVLQGGSYATSVTSPYTIDSGSRALCTGYSIDGAANITGASYTFTNVQANHTITYYWQVQYYLSIVSSYGNQQGIGWYNTSTTATFSVTTPFSGGTGIQRLFTSWTGTGTGSYSGTSSSYTVTMNNAITETATWQTQYLITPSNDTHSAITPSTATWVNAGASQSFNYSATSPYNITGLYIDSISNSTLSGTYTFSNVQQPHTIQVFSAETIPPTYTSISANSTIVNTPCNLSITFNDAVALEPKGQWQFGTNNTGTWVWTSLANFTSTPETLQSTITLNETVGTVVACQYNATNNVGTNTSTSIQILTTADVQPTPTPEPTDSSGINPVVENVFGSGLGALAMLAIVPIVTVSLSIIGVALLIKRNEGMEGESDKIAAAIIVVIAVNIVVLVGILLLNSFHNIFFVLCC